MDEKLTPTMLAVVASVCMHHATSTNNSQQKVFCSSMNQENVKEAQTEAQTEAQLTKKETK